MTRVFENGTVVTDFGSVIEVGDAPITLVNGDEVSSHRTLTNLAIWLISKLDAEDVERIFNFREDRS